MSRKLIHSIRALAVTFGVFTAALIIGTPASLDSSSASLALQRQASDIHVSAAAVPQASDVKPAPGKPHQRRRRARDEMALPFFSFAHVLRRGNGS